MREAAANTNTKPIALQLVKHQALYQLEAKVFNVME
jgi:hypothetical protein